MESNRNRQPPNYDTVLDDQDNHVSSAICNGEERGPLKCHENTSKLHKWKLTAKQIELIEKAGFGYFRFLPSINLDKALVSALVERWRRETNTFHMTVGEMTITLEDVALLLGLKINGDPFIRRKRTSNASSICEKLLGKVPIGILRNGSVNLSWLRKCFRKCPEDASQEEIECYTRAYLLYLVGCSIFCVEPGNRVSVRYLSYFEDFEEAGKLAWGAAALAFLYRALGDASLKSSHNISGCLTLLQCWCYSRLNLGLQELKGEPEYNIFPFMLGWKGKVGVGAKPTAMDYRKALNSLDPSKVEWLPYQKIRTPIPEDIKASLQLGLSKTMLFSFDKAERHLPNRCLRQFGMRQPVPEKVESWKRKISSSRNLEALPFITEWSKREENIEKSDDTVNEDDYFQWYQNITQRYIGKPCFKAKYERAVTALKEINKIADSMSSEGTYNRDRVDEIMNIVHKCLAEQFEDLVND